MNNKKYIYLLICLLAFNVLLCQNTNWHPYKDSSSEDSVHSSNSIDTPRIFFNDTYEAQILYNLVNTCYSLLIYEEIANGKYIYSIDLNFTIIVVDDFFSWPLSPVLSLTWINYANIGLFYKILNITDIGVKIPRVYNVSIQFNSYSPLEIFKIGNDMPGGLFITHTYVFRNYESNILNSQLYVDNVNDFRYNFTIMTENTEILMQHYVMWPNISMNTANGGWRISKIWNNTIFDGDWETTTLSSLILIWNVIGGTGIGYPSTDLTVIHPPDSTLIQQDWNLVIHPDQIRANYSARFELEYKWEFHFQSGSIYRFSYDFVPIYIEPCEECLECEPVRDWNWGDYLAISLGGSAFIAVGTYLTYKFVERKRIMNTLKDS